MAYNISVAIPATQPDQRWQWVKNGYELLRDQGIVLNPRSILLYRELARIFQHKIGAVSDDAHKYYKLQLALAMEPLLGPADNRYFQALAQAPTEWHRIVKDPNVAPLITALKAADKTFADDDKFVSNYLSLRQNPGRFEPDAFRAIDDFRGKQALKKFDIFAKAHYLRTVWKLDPVLMHRLNQTFGPVNWNDPNTHLPLDWRHPDTHAIYWAVKGLEAAHRENFSVTEVNTDRIINHSLQNLFRNGKIFIYDIPADQLSRSSSQPTYVPHKPGMLIKDTPESMRPKKEIFLRSDLRMFASYDNSVLARIEKYKYLEEIKTGTYESLKIGHRNMLENALFSFYQAGHKNYAQKIYNRLRQLYPRDEFKVSLVAYTRSRLREELRNIGVNNAKEMVQMLLRESYFRYAVRDDDQAAARETWAKEVHDRYQSQYPADQTIDLPGFKLLKYFALIDFLNDGQYPPTLRRNLLGRIRIERPDLVSQFEKLAEQLSRQEKKR